MLRILPLLLLYSPFTHAATLEDQLKATDPNALAIAARETGDARRGAILFHQPHIGCVKCHAVDGSKNALGPDLTRAADPSVNDAHVVTSVLNPSAVIRKGFESVTIVTTKGTSETGLLVKQDDSEVVIRDPATGTRRRHSTDDLDDVVQNKLSLMPAGLANQLRDRQQFLDLIRYVLEIRDGGIEVARTLQPPPGMITLKIPEYEKSIDHAGLIRALDDDAFNRGQKIYERLCINCHGNKDRPGSLPTALRFAEGKFRHGADPYTMYKTLTHGFGLMVAQSWMVPKQKYDVIHYIRESYVRDANPQQYVALSDMYLDNLPKGDNFGPEPVEYAPWSDMNYGPSMINTFEVGSDRSNFAFKGIAVRLDKGPGGVSKGNHWAVFDHDTMRVAAFWSRDPASQAPGFINWQGIHFDGRHGKHPQIVGDLHFENPTGPGWADPATGSFDDDQRIIGRDDRRYGPLPGPWAKYRGLHTIGDDTIIEYTVEHQRALEQFGLLEVPIDEQPAAILTRSMSLDRYNADHTLLVATLPTESADIVPVASDTVLFRSTDVDASTVGNFSFDGSSWLLGDGGPAFDMASRSFTLAARIRTTKDGTIFSQCKADGPWIPDGKTFFLRGGRLTYDIGWVGAVQSKRRVNDGKWHDVAMTWDHKSGRVDFSIDGKKNGGGTLRPKGAATDHVVKVGFTASNFPATSPFAGEIEFVRFYPDIVSDPKGNSRVVPVADWQLAKIGDADRIPNGRAAKHDLEVIRGKSDSPKAVALLAGVLGASEDFAFRAHSKQLVFDIPARQSASHILVWTVPVSPDSTADQLQAIRDQVMDLAEPTDLFERVQQTGSARWPDIITTLPVIGPDDGPFAVDRLSAPENNPWFCRLRFSGHDFFDDGDRLAVCSWDGDVWTVTGLKSLDTSTPTLKWQRIASGLFQPLGLKIVAGDVYLTCRDQLVILRDRNGDGETDYYECFNNDHQVTEHFHEFAMGLQRDNTGNFYYAKSARHAKKAVVPHHGTLLRIPSDGSETEILATGFRAANGVCLNPDGSFIVTDQEGHWNPKNRINWVHKGGFYGNMFGYHDVTDSSDDAMVPPLCWITNEFDRSPAELLWVNDDQWGPLNGSLLNLSYGYGKVYVVPHEEIDGQMQGGMCQLPIPQFPTGTMRGRINPHDHGLYVCGLFAWASSQQASEGGLFRIRPTGKPSYLPVGLSTRGKTIRLTFSDPINADFATDVDRYTITVWSLKRTANYGSKHYDEHEIAVDSARISNRDRTITLTVPELAPTWGMEIECRLPCPDGKEVDRVIHNTIHTLAD